MCTVCGVWVCVQWCLYFGLLVHCLPSSQGECLFSFATKTVSLNPRRTRRPPLFQPWYWCNLMFTSVYLWGISPPPLLLVSSSTIQFPCWKDDIIGPNAWLWLHLFLFFSFFLLFFFAAANQASLVQATGSCLRMCLCCCAALVFYPSVLLPESIVLSYHEVQHKTAETYSLRKPKHGHCPNCCWVWVWFFDTWTLFFRIKYAGTLRRLWWRLEPFLSTVSYPSSS